jgi:hypothetical protein
MFNVGTYVMYAPFSPSSALITKAQNEFCLELQKCTYWKEGEPLWLSGKVVKMRQ